MEAVLGIDVGTMSTEGILVSLATGSVLARVNVEYAPGFSNPEGHTMGAEQKPKVWRDAALRVSNEVTLEAEKLNATIGAVAVSGMVGGLNVPVDRDFTPLRSVPIWLDQRAQAEARAAAEAFNADALMDITGNGDISPYFGFCKLLWYMVHDTENYRRTRYLSTPQGLLVRMLTDEHVTDTSSLGAFGGLLDLERREVSGELMDELGRLASRLSGQRLELDPGLFGHIVSPEATIGPVTPGGAALSGLPEGIPVVASGIDAAVALLASGSRSPGDNTLIMGTSWCLGVLTDIASHGRVRGMVNVPHVLHGDRLIFSMTGGSFTGATAGFWLPELVTRTSFEDLEREAGLLDPGSGGVTFLPYLMGDRTPLGQADLSGAFVGLRVEHNRAHMFRAVLEGGAMLHDECMAEARAMGAGLTPTRMVDGPYRSSLWRGIIADLTGEVVHYVPDFPGTAYGDAMLAAISTGLLTEEKAFTWVPEAWVIEPSTDPDRIEAYRLAKERFMRFRARFSEDVT